MVPQPPWGTLPCALSTRTKRLAARDPGKGRLVRPKSPFKLKEIWAIRIRLQIAKRIRDLALFNLAIDSKLRGCDLVHLGDMAHVIASSPAQRTHALRS